MFLGSVKIDIYSHTLINLDSWTLENSDFCPTLQKREDGQKPLLFLKVRN